MSETYTAHIFGRRKVGQRDEVRMKLFQEDGSPLEIPTGPNPLDVAPLTLDMALPYPYTADCKGRTAVHLRKLTIPSNASTNSYVTLVLNNLELGTPYQVTILNSSNVPHFISLYINGFYVNPIVTSEQGWAQQLHLPPGQMCSIIGLFTGSTDRPLGVVTKPGSPAIRRVTGSYVLNTDFDINPLIFINSSGPATITLRDLSLSSSWWEGEEAEFYQEGAGAVTIAAPAGTTITRPGGATGSFVMPGRYSTVKLRAVGMPKWAVTYYTPATGL